MPVAYVEWVDAGIAATRWEDRAEVIEEADRLVAGLIRSSGFLISQTADRLVLSGSVNPNNDDVNLTMVIPVSCVRKLVTWEPNETVREAARHAADGLASFEGDVPGFAAQSYVRELRTALGPG